MLLNKFAAGHAAMAFLQKAFPAQVGGLLFGATEQNEKP